MNCKDVRQHLWDLCDGELANDVAAEVRAHVAACPSCAREAELGAKLSSALKPMPVMKAPVGASRNVLAAIRPMAAERRAAKSRMWFVGVAWAAAASVVAALGLFGYLPGLGGRGPAVSAVATAAVSARTAIANTAADTLATASAKSAQYVPGGLVPSKADVSFMMTEATPWLVAAGIVLAAILAFAAFEEDLSSRRLEARIRALAR